MFRATPKTLLIAALAVVLAPAQSSAENFTAQIFELGSERKKLLFEEVGHDTLLDNGQTQSDSIYKDLQGNEVAREHLILNGEQFARYELEKLQVNQSGTLEVRHDKAYYTHTRDGKTSHATEKVVQNLIVGPTTVPFLKKHWEELMSGKEVEARFAVLDRLESIGFVFSIQDLKKTAPHIVIKMSAANLIIASLVKPLFFEFDEAQNLLNLKGRTTPRVLEGGRFKELDAETVYQYGAESPGFGARCSAPFRSFRAPERLGEF